MLFKLCSNVGHGRDIWILGPDDSLDVVRIMRMVSVSQMSFEIARM